ncbi:hypothetical protein [Pseudomonas sp.]|uniref:hypothetical protein n=1 Tax=Pseudomonas sp. TaxID=306 RepID=UPI003267AF88
MSTFAVFGMTIDVATAEARKKTSGTRKNLKVLGGVEPIPEAEWLELVRKRTEKIMGGYSASALANVRCAAVRRAVYGTGSQDLALS